MSKHISISCVLCSEIFLSSLELAEHFIEQHSSDEEFQVNNSILILTLNLNFKKYKINKNFLKKYCEFLRGRFLTKFSVWMNLFFYFFGFPRTLSLIFSTLLNLKNVCVSLFYVSLSFCASIRLSVCVCVCRSLRLLF